MSSLRWFTSVMRVNEIQDSRGKVMHSGNNTLELVMLISGLENNCNHSKEKNKKKKERDTAVSNSVKTFVQSVVMVK